MTLATFPSLSLYCIQQICNASLSDVLQVREVFEEVVGRGLTPNLAIWNTLLASLAAQGAWLDALSALRQVRNSPEIP